MTLRTVKGAVFTILVDGKRIVVKHVFGKGKRCRVIVPPGVVVIEEQRRRSAVIDRGNSIHSNELATSCNIGITRKKGPRF